MRREEYIVTAQAAEKRLRLAVEEAEEFEKIQSVITDRGLVQLKRKRMELAIATAKRIVALVESQK